MERDIKKLIETLHSTDQSEILRSIQSLTMLGDKHLDLISDALIQTQGIPEPFKKVITYMEPPRDITKLCAFLRSNNSDLAIACFEALALSKDIDCLKCLYEVYESTWRKELAAETIGKLGYEVSQPFLVDKMKEVVDTINKVLTNDNTLNSKDSFDESNLTLYMHLLKALRQIGINDYGELLPAIAKYKSGDPYSSYRVIRSNAIELLGEISFKSSLQLIKNSIHDDYFEIREASFMALLLIGTTDAIRPLFQIDLENEISRSNNLLWCLEQWSGLAMNTIEEYKVWWQTNESLFITNKCYRYGDLMDMNVLISNLTGGITELRHKFKELEIYSGIDFSICMYRNPEIDLIDKVNMLWNENGFHFERGNHYRYGRKVSFDLG